jgi:hypothetical protein
LLTESELERDEFADKGIVAGVAAQYTLEAGGHPRTVFLGVLRFGTERAKRISSRELLEDAEPQRPVFVGERHIAGFELDGDWLRSGWTQTQKVAFIELLFEYERRTGMKLYLDGDREAHDRILQWLQKLRSEHRRERTDSGDTEVGMKASDTRKQSKTIEAGASVLPDIFNATASFYIRRGSRTGTTEWIEFARKTESGRGKGIWASTYVILPDPESFVEVKVIVSHHDHYDCETETVRYDWSGNGGVRMLGGCCCMYEYRK